MPANAATSAGDLPWTVRAARMLAWLCLIVLAILSWLPGEEMVRTGVGARIEHFVAYLLTGLIAAHGYLGRYGWAVAILLGGYAGLMELGQFLASGRHPAFLDFVVSASGAIVGTTVVALARRLAGRGAAAF